MKNEKWKYHIRIEGLEGYYYIEDNTLIYNYDDDLQCKDECNECQVSDLTDLTIYQYEDLVSKLNKHYPEYAIDYLEGRFI